MDNPVKYSICFQPDAHTIDIVRQMKLRLAEKIGWYNSKNSLGHITIVEFQTDHIGISKIAEAVKQLCNTFQPIQVVLNDFGQFPNGAFYLTVDDFSKPILQNYAKKIASKITVPKVYKSSEPHLSIARKLDVDKLATAFAYFDKPTIPFLCDQIAIRRFNIERGQYDVLYTYSLLGMPSNEPEQLSLF